MRPARRTLCLLALAVVPGAVVVGCSDDDAAGRATAPATTAGPVMRVVQGDELPGFVASPARTLDPAAISSENDVDEAELGRRGVVRMVKAELSGPPDAFGVTAAEELASPEQARAEAARLFAANGTSEPGFTATPISVPAIPGARGARKSGSRDGVEFVAVEIAWADGSTAHELFVLGRAKDVDQAAVVAAAQALSAGG